jgi:2-polyprenyl-3-methyl-5-hydroxy-6-metoxy-1,4-benzoquinol methylase
LPLSPVTRVPRPSTWFFWQAHFIHPGARVLDLACGEGRHGLAAAALGATVLAVDKDSERLATARDIAAARGLSAEFREVDLGAPWPSFGEFDVVLLFNYLDRQRMSDVVGCVAPGGVLIMETFLDAQRELGWGPQNGDHLLKPGELGQLVEPLEVLHGREVLEPVDAERWRAVASIVARRVQ